MRNLTKKLLFLILTVVMALQVLAIPVSASGATRDPYESFLAISLDSSEKGVTIMADRVGTITAANWACFKNMDFGKVGPYKVEIETTMPAQYSTTTVVLKLDGPKGTTFAEIPITPSSDWGVGFLNSADIKTDVTGVHDLYVTCKDKTLAFRNMVFYTTDGGDEQFKYEKYSKAGSFSDIEDEACAIEMLSGLGIISSSEDGIYDSKKSASRGEFANSVFRIFVEDSGEEPKQTVTRFADVKSDYKYAEAIDYLSQRGIMNGASETEFAPSSYITYVDALTVILRALGYKDVAERDGGYPDGYARLASNIKINLTDISFDEYITKSDMALLLKKTLDADYLTVSSVVNGRLELEKHNGILGMTRNLYKGKGVIKATALTMLNMPNSGLELNEVNIDGRIYKTGGINVFGLLGFECDLWYFENDGERILYSIVPKSSTEYFEISSEKDEIISISNSKIKYIPAGESKESTIDISSDTAVIYNCVAIEKDIISAIDYEDSFSGTISYVENGDGSSVLLIDEYNDYVVESVDYYTSTLKGIGFDDKITLDGEKNFVSIIAANGRSSKASNLKTGDVVTVYQSKNSDEPKVVRLYISDKTINSKVLKKYNDDIYIGETVYTKSNHYKGDLSVGQSGIFYLNIYGDIVNFEVDTKAPPLVGMYMEYDAKDEALDKHIEIKFVDEMGKVQIYPVAQKVTYNGKKFENIDEIINDMSNDGKISKGLENLAAEEIFRYKLNTNGEISMIDTCDELLGGVNDTMTKLTDSAISMNYALGSKILASSGVMKYYMNDSDLVYSYYRDIEDKEDFWTVGTAKSMFPGETSVSCLAYSTGGKKHVADVAVFSRTIEYGCDWNAPIIVDSVTTGLDEDGFEAVIVTGFGNGGAKVNYTVSEKFVPFNGERALLENVKKGDVIRVKLCKDKIVDASVIFFCDGAESRAIGAEDPINANINKNKVSVIGSGLDWRYIYGRVDYVDNNYIAVETFMTDNEGNITKNIEVVGKPMNTTLNYKRSDGTYIVSGGKPVSAISVDDTVLALIVDGNTSQVIVYDIE